ncbi:MAG: tRNA (guanosine(46)-N7)-methyltransferase TrmB [Pseudomonadota bacterium]
MPALRVPLAAPGTLTRQDLFPDARALWLEIGFGGGEHLVHQALANRDVGLIGCEPFVDGMAKALSAIDGQGAANIRLHMDDARPVLAGLAPGSLERVFLLFPDPWPKVRQHKRRLVQPGFLDLLAAALAPGGQVRFATDVRSYGDHALSVFLADGRFTWLAERAQDWRCPPADHVTTRYEAKRLGDIAPVWFDFAHAPSSAPRRTKFT